MGDGAADAAADLQADLCILAIAKAALDVPQAQRVADTTQPILGTNKEERVAYCVVVEPNQGDFHEHAMTEDAIKSSAHHFMAHSRVIKSMHKNNINAQVVESYVAPSDLHFSDATHGEQDVTKGSWVIGIKVKDPEQWARIKSGEYTGVSVSGFAVGESVS